MVENDNIGKSITLLQGYAFLMAYLKRAFEN